MTSFELPVLIGRVFDNATHNRTIAERHAHAAPIALTERGWECCR